MNYRHAHHAGNFADLVKHAALIALLERLTAERGPLQVIDTHAGAGLYDLDGPEARRSGEAQAGVARLMAAEDPPAPLAALRRAVAAASSGPTRLYPGSPWLIAQALRPGDRLLACELRPAEHAALRRALAGGKGIEAVCADGYAEAARRAAPGRLLVLIDPPFEEADEAGRIARAARAILARNRFAVVAIWAPLKDLEGFDHLVREVEGAAGGAAVLVAEARLRPLVDPMRMNGCALIVLGEPDGFDAVLEQVCGWVVQSAGEGGAARIWRPA